MLLNRADNHNTKHIRSSAWKYLGFHVADNKVTNIDKAVCGLYCTKLLSYSTMTTDLWTHLLTSNPGETAEAPQTRKKRLSVTCPITSECLSLFGSADKKPVNMERR